MTKLLGIAILTLIYIGLVTAASTKTDTVPKNLPTTVAPSDQESSIERNVIDTEAIMNMCNDSFRIEMAYLESLNQSGSFIDESDKTPKCFIRCVLENTGVMSEDTHQIDPARAAVIFAGERNGKTMDDIGDMTALCAADRKETCACEKSYKFVRCLMSKEIERYETPE